MTVVADLISVGLDANWWHRRRPCLFCGGCSDKEAVSARVYSDVIDQGAPHGSEPQRHADTGHLQTQYIVCGECLALSPADLQRVIRENAAWHRERATELDAIADNLPALPSVQEWQKANDESWG